MMCCLTDKLPCDVADTGMRISWCKRCDAKHEWVDMQWVRVTPTTWAELRAEMTTRINTTTEVSSDD